MKFTMADLRKAFQLHFCCGSWNKEHRSENKEFHRLQRERRELEREEEMKRMELRKVEEKRRKTDIIRKLEEERRRRRLAHERFRRSERQELQKLRQQKKLKERQVESERPMEEERELAHKRELELQMEKERPMEEERELADKTELQMDEQIKVEEVTDGEMEPVRQRMEEVQKEPSMKDEESEEQVEMDRKKQKEEKERMERIKEVKNMERQQQREAITVKPLAGSYQSSHSTFIPLQYSRPTTGPLVIMVKQLVPILDPEEDEYDQFSLNASSPLPAPSKGTGAEIEASPEQNLRPEEKAPAPKKSCKDAGAKRSPRFPNVTSRVKQWVSKKMERYQKEIQEVQNIVEQHGDKYCFGSPSDTLQGKFFLVADYYGEMRERLQEEAAQWQAREAYWREKGRKWE